MYNAKDILEVIYEVLAGNEVSPMQREILTESIEYIDYDSKTIKLRVRDTAYKLTIEDEA